MAFSTASKVACAAALAVLTVTLDAHAEPTAADQLRAQSLFDQGRQLMAERRFGEACPLFAESQRLDPGGGTLLNLAVCHEGEGKTASAWSEFNEALSLAIKDGRKDRETLARRRIAVLEPELDHLTLVVPPTTQVNGLVVTLDGGSVNPTAWGLPTAADPGSHRIEAQAPGKQKWAALVMLGPAGDAKRIEIPALADETVASAPPSPPPVPSSSSSPPPPEQAHASVSSKSPWRYAVGAVGIAGLATSVVTGFLALHEHSVASNNCNPDRNFCSTQDALNADSEAKTWGWVSTITLGAGVAGVVAFLLWPRDTVTIDVGAAPRPGGASLAVSGSF